MGTGCGLAWVVSTHRSSPGVVGDVGAARRATTSGCFAWSRSTWRRLASRGGEEGACSGHKGATRQRGIKALSQSQAILPRQQQPLPSRPPPRGPCSRAAFKKVIGVERDLILARCGSVFPPSELAPVVQLLQLQLLCALAPTAAGDCGRRASRPARSRWSGWWARRTSRYSLDPAAVWVRRRAALDASSAPWGRIRLQLSCRSRACRRRRRRCCCLLP